MCHILALMEMHFLMCSSLIIHIIHMPYHVVICHNMAHTTNLKRQYSLYILMQVSTELKIEIHIINSFPLCISHI